MKKHLMKRAMALAAAAVLVLSVNAAALFGGETKTQLSPGGGAPTVQPLEVRTYRNISCQAKFLATDSEGDAPHLCCVRKPPERHRPDRGGHLHLHPGGGKSGKDTFTYTATDSAGHTSQPAAVTVRIEKDRSGIHYADTEGSPAAAAAQDLAELGIFTGAKIGTSITLNRTGPSPRGQFWP